MKHCYYNKEANSCGALLYDREAQTPKEAKEIHVIVECNDPDTVEVTVETVVNRLSISGRKKK